MGVREGMQQTSDDSSEFRDLWVSFSQSASQAEYCQRWLELQCARIPYAKSGVLLLRADSEGNESYTVTGSWPASSEPQEAIAELADRVVDEQCGLVSDLEEQALINDIPMSLYGVAYPLKIDQQIAGIVAVAVAAGGDKALAFSMEQLQWGVSWVELMIRRHQRGILSSELPRLRSAVEVVTSVLADDSFELSSMTFVTELAAILECERVSLGIMRYGKISVKAISNSAEFGKQMNLVRMLEAAMEEAVFQRSDIRFPAAADCPFIIHDHARLSDKHGSGAIYSLPLFQANRYMGAVTFERPGDPPFSDDELEVARSVTALCGEALALKQRNDRPLYQVIGEFGYEQARRLLGAGYLGRKVAALLLISVTLFFSLAEETYRITGDTKLEGAVRQVVVAPFDGYVDSARARVGDW